MNGVTFLWLDSRKLKLLFVCPLSEKYGLNDGCLFKLCSTQSIERVTLFFLFSNIII